VNLPLGEDARTASMNTFDTDEKLKRVLPRGVEGEIGGRLSTGEDTSIGELGAVGIARRGIGGSTSTVSSSGITSSYLEDGLVPLPGMK
jgi:hypothetical protein